MALTKPNLLPLLISLIALFFMMLVNKVHSQGVTTFEVEFFDTQPMALTYQGDAHVPSGSNFLRLTKTDSSGTTPEGMSIGRILYSCPVKLWEQETARIASFETTFKFIIKPSKNGAADGIAFFMAPAGSTIPGGSTGENLGIFGSSGTSPSLFAVEFDTHVNAGFDPGFRHIGIDINSKNSKNITRFDSAVGHEVTARINYDGITRMISVVATSATKSFTVCYVLDLKTILPERVQVGLSSATGRDPEKQGIHDIHSWHFTSTLDDDVDKKNVRN